MLALFAKFTVRSLWLGVLVVLAVSVAMGQDATDRILEPGAVVSGTLDMESVAQVYALNGRAGQVVDLTVTGADGLAIVLSDAFGAALGQAVDSDATGTVEIVGLSLPQDGAYYATVLSTVGLGDSALTFELVFGDTESVDSEVVPEVITAGSLLTTGGAQISVVWDSGADINLEVRDPVGGSLVWDIPQTASGGRFASPNVNGSCEVVSANAPTEQVSWPPGAIPTGSYEVLVHYVQQCDAQIPVGFTVNTVVDGSALEPVQGVLQPGQAYITSFLVDAEGAVSSGPSGLDTADALPAPVDDVLAAAQPIARDVPVQGIIAGEQAYEAFSFSGQANEIISVNMSATTGNLDTLLLLLDESGNLVDLNDDQAFRVTDSIISNRRLVTDGVYTIVATRYGQTVGGTQGNFELTLSGPTADLPAEVLELGLPDGAIEVSLLWDTTADLQLLVRDPAGDAVYDDIPVVPSGGRLAANGNVNCVPSETRPVSYVFWPQGRLPAGTYEIDVWYQDTCGDVSPLTATLNLLVNEDVVLTETIQPVLGQRYVTTFSVGIDGSVSPGLGGIVGGSETLDFRNALQFAQTLTGGETVTGNITADNGFDVYVFDGEAGDVVSVGMEATAGTLDTTLFVLDPNGAEIAENDDAIAGEVTDSLISNLILPEDGQYIIIATHFGVAFGGTTGVYNLTFSQLS